MHSTNEIITELLKHCESLDRKYDFSKIDGKCQELKEYFGIEGLMENRMASDSSLLLQFVKQAAPRETPKRQSWDMVNLLPFWKWSKNKVTFTFDQDVEEALVEQTGDFMSGETPYSLLTKLPYPAFFVPTHTRLSEHDEFALRTFAPQARDYERVGFFFCVDEIYVQGRRNNIGIYWLFKDIPNDEMLIIPSYWDFTNTSAETVEDCLRQDRRKDAPEVSKKERTSDRLRTALAMQYVLYLCAENAEIDQNEENAKYYRPATPGFVKHRPREVLQFEAGKNTGILLREFKAKQNGLPGVYATGTGRVQSPHMRRAHWHRYWTGQKDNQTLSIRWIAPTYVHKELIGLVKPSKVRA